MKSKRTILSLLLAAFAVRAFAGGATNSNAPAKPLGLADLLTDAVVARGKGFEIKRSELDQAMVNARSQLAAANRQVQPGQLAMLEQQALDSLILVDMLNAKATPDEKARAREESDKELERFKKSFPDYPDDKTMTSQLAAMGMTLDQFRSDLNKQMVANVLLRAKAAVPDAEVRKYYDDNPSQFEHPERVRASHILLMTINPTDNSPLPDDQKAAKRKQIEDIRKRAVAGEDFAMLAKQYSDDPGSKDKGGEYIFGRGEMDPAFEAAAFALKTNEVSDIVTTRYGFHIIKLSERVPPGKTSFDDVSPSIRKYLETMAIQKFIPQYYVQLKKDAAVEILDDKLKAMEDAAAAKTPADSSAPAGK